ncbi:MAG: hypothetical protein Q8942_03160 [Bacillota bacterium]|nr:hypothetical protein [Bacillota bacterium]
MNSIKILAVLIIVVGFLTVIGAKFIVKRFELNKKVVCNMENELSEEEVASYKFTKAVVNCKMIGMLIALPGIIMFLFAFKNG